jgi:hypothetical protein
MIYTLKCTHVVKVVLTIFAYRRDGALIFHVRTLALSMAHVPAPAQCNENIEPAGQRLTGNGVHFVYTVYSTLAINE